jgi:hypothetical protein
VSATEVTELIAALRTGAMSLDEVAEHFRQRTWPITRRPVPTSFLEMAEQQDPPADIPGSFDEVTAAYDRGELTKEQYRTLAHAVADSINAEARREAEGQTTE